MKKNTDKLAELKSGLRKDYIQMVENYGECGELETFEYCSNYGCELSGSTIDKIEVQGDNVIFYYNENIGDFDTFNAFDLSDLAEFYDEVLTAIESELDAFGNDGEGNSARHDLEC